MKLVAAKCPSCNANIEVDKNSDSTKCDFCNTKIIVEDAIAKYKVEISGEVSVKNMPKLDSYLKLGERHYNDREFEEAYDNYSKASELDPDNWLIILRKGLCKTLCTNYLHFEYKPALNGVKNAYDILKKDDKTNEINQAIKEANQTFIELVGFVVNFYKSNELYMDGVNEANGRLLACIDAYTYLNTIVEDNEIKKSVLSALLYAIDRLLEGKRYNTGNYDKYARPIILTSSLNLKQKRHWMDMKVRYTYEKNMLDPEFAKQEEEKKKILEKHQEEIKRKNEKKAEQRLKRKAELEKKANDNLKVFFRPIDILSYLGMLFYLLLALGSFLVGTILTSIILLIGAIIFIPYVKNKIVSKDGELHYVINLARFGLLFVGLIIAGIEMIIISPEPYEGEWISESGMELTIAEGEVKLKNSDGEKIKDTFVEYYKDPYDDNINYYYELVVNKYDDEKEEITFRYTKYADDSKEFCIMENEKCATYFVPKEEESNTKYITSSKTNKKEEN